MRRTLLPSLLLFACRTSPTTTPLDDPPPVTDTPIGDDEVEQSSATISTAPPSGALDLRDATYDAAKDVRNTGGWNFVDERDPAARADAKKKPFSIAALYALRSVGAPHWSPDGSKLLFTVTQHDLAKGKSNRDIYVSNRDGSNRRRLTRDPAGDGQPRWLPDGRHFVFVSTREDGAQLWKMSIEGGEPERLTSISTGIDEIRLSPDGTRVGFVSSVYPEHGADDDANDKQSKARRDNPIKAHVADELLYRHWTAYDDGRRNHVLVYDLRDKTTIDVTPGDFHAPPFSYGDPGFAWSPDGTEICFVSNRDAPSARSWTTNKDLYVVPSKGGRAVNLTDDNEAFDGHPSYSPDGRFIAFRRQSEPGYESDRFRLALYDRTSGNVSVLTENFDRWVTDYAWAHDSKAIVFKSDDKGRTPLYRLTLQGGQIKRLALPSVRGFEVAKDGTLAFTFTSIGRPVELFTADADGDGARRLTGFNDEVATTYDVRPPQEVWIEGPDGRKIHTFIVKPHGYRKGKRYPLILNVHGGPSHNGRTAFAAIGRYTQDRATSSLFRTPRDPQAMGRR